MKETVGHFLAALIIGGVGIILIRILPGWMEGTHARAWMASSWAVICIVILGIVSRHDRQRAGDNLYYLGLLFTLLSLIYALIAIFPVGSEGDSSAGQIRKLVGSFGISLVSTVAGIIGRVVVQGLHGSRDRISNQTSTFNEPSVFSKISPFSKTSPFNEPSTFNQISDSGSGAPLANLDEQAPLLRKALREATEAFTHYTRTTREIAEQTRRKGEEAFSEFQERIHQQVEYNIQKINTAYEKIAARAHETQQTLDQKIEQIFKMAETLEREFTTTNSALHKLPESIRSVNDELTGFGQSTRQAEETLTTATQRAAEAYESLNKRVIEQERLLDEKYDSTTKNIDQLRTQTGQLTQIVSETSTGLEVVRKTNEELAETQRSIHELGQTAQGSRVQLRELEAQSQKTRMGLKQHIESVQMFSKGISDAGQHVAQLPIQVREAQQRVEQLRTTSGKSSDRIALSTQTIVQATQAGATAATEILEDWKRVKIEREKLDAEWRKIPQLDKPGWWKRLFNLFRP